MMKTWLIVVSILNSGRNCVSVIASGYALAMTETEWSIYCPMAQFSANTYSSTGVWAWLCLLGFFTAEGAENAKRREEFLFTMDVYERCYDEPDFA
jgi:hypothetical protein